MLKDVSFGQYYPVKSFVHSLDPRLKILFLIGFIVAIFLAKEFLALGICAAVLLLAVVAAHIPFGKVVRAVKGILFLVLFTAVVNVFFYQGEKVYWEGPAVLWQWKIFRVTQAGIIFSAFLVLRLFLLVVCSSLLTYTTTPVSLTDGIESLLTPLKWIRFPVHELALIMSIALRFIPILMDETDRIMNAQKARGANLDSGGPVKRVRAIVPVLIPLLLSAFRRADELGDAMDARCYSGGKNRTKYKKLRFSWRDVLGALLLSALIAAIVVMRFYPAFPL